MRANDRTHAIQRFDRAAQIVADDRMLSHQRQLLGIQPAGLQQHRIWQARSSRRRAAPRPDSTCRDPTGSRSQRGAERGRVFRQTLAMPFGIRITGFDDMPEHRHDRFGRLELIGQLLHAQQRADARAKLLHIDGLAEKIVCSGFDARECGGCDPGWPSRARPASGACCRAP